MTEQWTTSQVAEYLNVTRNSAGERLRYWGVAAVGRETGSHGEHLYDAAAVKAAAANRPGPGARTDLIETRDEGGGFYRQRIKDAAGVRSPFHRRGVMTWD